jgi:hypothetical protein
VADLIAFAVVLAIDPNAAAPRVTPAAPEPPEADSPVTPAPDEPDPGEAPPRRRPRLDIAAHALAADADAPSAMFGGGLSAVLTLSAGSLKPSFRLGAEYAAAASQSASTGYVSFARALSIEEVCPTELGSDALSLRVCLRSEVGLHLVAGHRLANAERTTRAWFALGPEAHARMRVGGPISVDLAGGVAFPVTRDEIYVGPALPVYTAASAGAVGELAVVVSIP